MHTILEPDGFNMSEQSPSTGPYALWPDGTYCDLDKVGDYLTFWSDDYEVIIDLFTLKQKLGAMLNHG